MTQGKGDALTWAQEVKDVDRVIASGGDGTIMEAMSGLIKNDLPIPLATCSLAPNSGNSLSAEL